VCRLQAVQQELRARAEELFVLLSQHVTLEDAPAPSSKARWAGSLQHAEAEVLSAHCTTVRRLVQHVVDDMVLEEAVEPAVYTGSDDVINTDDLTWQRQQAVMAQLMAQTAT
jgi:hypothetical protein